MTTEQATPADALHGEESMASPVTELRDAVKEIVKRPRKNRTVDEVGLIGSTLEAARREARTENALDRIADALERIAALAERAAAEA